jgi:hypothetical protein
MKKIMMVLAVVLAAVSVNAASVYWSVEEGPFVDWTGADIDGSKPITAVLFALAGSDAAISYSNGSWNNLDSATLVDSTSAFEDGWANWDGASTTINNADQQYFQVVLVQGASTDLAGLATGTQFYVLDAAEAGINMSMTPGSTDVDNYEIFMATSTTKAGWAATTASVPEPTSGLLLILGMAGLALKRKIA